ncbi:MAG: hypothetical protein AAFX78_08485 [Cyanobacteria bacterium J06638_20]
MWNLTGLCPAQLARVRHNGVNSGAIARLRKDAIVGHPCYKVSEDYGLRGAIALNV